VRDGWPSPFADLGSAAVFGRYHAATSRRPGRSIELCPFTNRSVPNTGVGGTTGMVVW
jgi:hypothetical protein